MKKEFLKNNFPVILIILLAIVPAIVLYNYFINEAKDIRKDKENDLTSIAQMKAEQIKSWLKERNADALVLKESSLYGEELRKIINNPNDWEEKKKLLERIDLAKRYYEYENIIITDAKGNKIISVDNMAEHLSILTKQRVKEAIRGKVIYQTDIYYCEDCKKLHLDLIVPQINGQGNVFATTIMRINPQTHLFPMVQSLSMPSKTLETLLAQREGNSIVLCNDLRFRKNAAMKIELSIKDTDIMAVKAMKGERGIKEGKDYRGMNVIADLRPIEGTRWIMVTKIDKEELFSEINYRKNVSIALIIFTLLLIIILAYNVYNINKRATYQKLYAKEKELNKIDKEFRTTLYSIGDAVIITDNAGIVTNINSMAEKLTGWKESDAIRKPIENVFKIINEESRKAVESPVKKVLREGLVVGLANHTLLISKDGNETPIADSGAPVKNEKGEITGVVLVCRDQTDERTIIKNLADSKMRFQKLFTSINDGICLHELVFDKEGKPYDYRILEVNDKFIEMTGITKEKAIGSLASELYGTEKAPYFDIYSEVAITGKSVTFETYFAPMRKHFRISVFSPEHKQFATAFQDITEKKHAEDIIKASELRYRSLFESAKDGIIILDAESGKIEDVNPYLIDMLGFSHNEFLGKKIWEIGFFKDIISNQDKFAELQKNDYVRYENLPLRTSDGYKRDVEFVSNIYNVNNHAVIQCNIRDISERKLAEEKLRRSEEQYRLLAEHMSDTIWLMDMDMQTTYMSPSTERIRGYSLKEIQQLSLEQHLSPASYKIAIESFSEELKKIKSDPTYLFFKTIELEFNRKDGTMIWMENMFSLIRDENGKPVNIIGEGRNITERKRAEEELKESEEKYKAYVNSAPNGIYIVDGRGNFIDVNDTACIILGYTKEELQSKNIIDVTPQKHHEFAFEKFQKMLSTGKVEFELEYQCKDETTGWWMINAIYLSENRYLGYTTVTTERKRAEEAIRLSEARLLNAVEIAKLGYWEYDVEKDLFIFNDSFYKIFRTSAKKVGGYEMTAAQYAERFVHPDDRDLVGIEVQKAIESSDTDFAGKIDHRIIYEDGETGFISVHFTIIKDSEGRTIKTIGANQDITERKEKEVELMKAKDKAEESNRLKTSFLANMSHEIRTPMNAIVGFSTFLKEPDLTQSEKDQYCDIIQDNSNNLLQIIEDILEISKIESGHIHFMVEKTNINELFKNLLTEFRHSNKNDSIEISCRIDELDEDLITLTDSSRLKQVMNNLIINALKFTKQGKVEFGYKLVRSSEFEVQSSEKQQLSSAGYIEFYVKDTGIGIDKKYKEIIFERFRQVEDFTTRMYGGSGLGLAISKKIVEAMGGKIWVETELKKGSEFIFSLPLIINKEKPKSKSKSEKKVKGNDLSDLKILIAEDDDDNYKLFEIIFKKTKIKMIRAKDGVECLELFKSNKDIDIVLMDIQMPLMNGLDATRIIKQIRKEVPVIAQTAFALSSDRGRCMEAGCDDVITKPINFEKLYSLIKKYLI